MHLQYFHMVHVHVLNVDNIQLHNNVTVGATFIQQRNIKLNMK